MSDQEKRPENALKGQFSGRFSVLYQWKEMKLRLIAVDEGESWALSPASQGAPSLGHATESPLRRHDQKGHNRVQAL